MNGYEPVGTVSQNAAAGAAMFGAPRQDNSLEFARLQQQGNLAQQGLQQEQQRLNQDQSQFQQGVQLQQEQQKAQSAENTARRQHELNLEKQRNDNENALSTQVFQRQQQLKIAEIEFAKANAEKREQLAPRLIQLRKDAADADAKLGAYQVLTKTGGERIADFIKQAENMREMIVNSSKEERALGARSATAALNRIQEDLQNAGTDGKRSFMSMAGTLVETGDEVLGFDLLDASSVANRIVGDAEGGSAGFGLMMDELQQTLSGTGLVDPNEANEFAQIDQNKVNSRAAELVSRYIARSISEQTGDKFAPEEVRSFIDAMMKGEDAQAQGDAATNLMKMQKLGISPEVLKSALVGLADSLEGVDNPNSLFNKRSIMQKMDSADLRSADRMALQATLQLINRMQSNARMVSAQLQSVDPNMINGLLGYLSKATKGGGRINRDELAALVPSMAGSDADESLIDALRSDTDLGQLEALGADPFGFMNREIGSLQKRKGQLAIDELGLQQQVDMLDEGGSRDLQGLIDRLGKIK